MKFGRYSKQRKKFTRLGRADSKRGFYHKFSFYFNFDFRTGRDFYLANKRYLQPILQELICREFEKDKPFEGVDIDFRPRKWFEEVPEIMYEKVRVLCLKLSKIKAKPLLHIWLYRRMINCNSDDKKVLETIIHNMVETGFLDISFYTLGDGTDVIYFRCKSYKEKVDKVIKQGETNLKENSVLGNNMLNNEKSYEENDITTKLPAKTYLSDEEIDADFIESEELSSEFDKDWDAD